MKVCHIIVGLDVGGAELMLARLIESHQNYPDYQHQVISLTSIGSVGQRLQRGGVEVFSLDMRSLLDVPRGLWRLRQKISELGPDVVQTWMYHADLLGGLAARWAGQKNIIWGIHSTYVQAGGSSATTLVMRVCALLSRWIPHTILCVAEVSRNVHIAAGYHAPRMIVLPNGIDLSAMRASQEDLTALKALCGFKADNIVVGTVGRFNPAKDYENFVRAAGLLVRRCPQVRFLMVGLDLTPDNAVLAEWIGATGCADRFVLLGERTDAAVCMAAMDIFCLSSRSEALPTVVVEAMAMCVPCVVTDVGDTAALIADTGVAVPKEDSVSLAQGMERLLNISVEGRRRLGRRARQRVEKEFTIERARTRLENLYRQLSAGKKDKK